MNFKFLKERLECRFYPYKFEVNSSGCYFPFTTIEIKHKGWRETRCFLCFSDNEIIESIKMDVDELDEF